MKKNIQIAFITILFSALLLGACASTGEPVSTEIPKDITPSLTEEVPAEASAVVEAAIQELASQLGVEATSIKLISVKAEEWPDGCLGAPEPDEMCTQVITPGFGGILEVNGVQYEFRSDESGGQIRIIPGALSAAQQALASKLGSGIEDIQMVSLKRMTWNDSCLGVHTPKVVCLEVITPGYQVVLLADGKQYVYNTDETGKNLALAEFPLPGLGDALVVWSESTEVGCQLALIDTDKISFGACEGEQTSIPFPVDLAGGDLTYLIQKYAPFEAEAAGGKLSFTGEGTEIATASVQRMIGEWARLARQIAETGSIDPTWGRVLTWHREGGIAGFCDDLSVYVTGVVLASSCKLEQPVNPARTFLNAGQLEQLYAWVDGLKSFEIDQTDPGTADAMTIQMQFAGNGEEEASAEQQQAIQDFAAQVYTQASSGNTTE